MSLAPRAAVAKFRHNAVRLLLHALTYNLRNFTHTLALPNTVEQWSMTTLREKLVNIGPNILHHGSYFIFKLAEVTVLRSLFADILSRIDRLRPAPTPS